MLVMEDLVRSGKRLNAQEHGAALVDIVPERDLNLEPRHGAYSAQVWPKERAHLATLRFPAADNARPFGIMLLAESELILNGLKGSFERSGIPWAESDPLKARPGGAQWLRRQR
jgi:hypothetical protein